MRVLIDGNVHDPLSPAEEQDVRQFRAEESVQGTVLSADEAAAVLTRETSLLFLILWGLAAIAAAIIAPLAEPADREMVFGAAALVLGALAAFFALVFWRRKRNWRHDLPRRLGGMAPAGTVIGVTAAGIAVAGQNHPWSTLATEQVELTRFSSRGSTVFTLERLTLAGPGGVVVLDPAVMRNGHLIIGNAWRRMRLAGPNGAV